MIQIHIPYKLPSESNMNDHWRAKHSRKKKLQKLLLSYWPSDFTPFLPCIVTMTRISPRSLDSDNLRGAFKSIRDNISSKLIPGKMAGMADSDPRIEWRYEQRHGKVKEYGLIIKISPK